MLGDALPKSECVRVHFEPRGLVFGLRECGLEFAVDDFAGAAGAEAHGQHVIDWRERVRAISWQEEAEIPPVHVSVGDELSEAVQADHALAVVGGNPLFCMELASSLGPASLSKAKMCSIERTQ